MLVAKRLEGQMTRMAEAESGAGEGEKERELAKAALSVAELGSSICASILWSQVRLLTL